MYIITIWTKYKQYKDLYLENNLIIFNVVLIILTVLTTY